MWTYNHNVDFEDPRDRSKVKEVEKTGVFFYDTPLNLQTFGGVYEYCKLFFRGQGLQTTA